MYKSYLAPILYSLFRPSQLRIILRDLFRVINKTGPNSTHLQACMQWLNRSQDHWDCGGCAATFGFYSEWGPPYQETTGYIISTMLRYAEFTGDKSFADRARRMGDWEIEVQLPSGAVKGGYGIEDYPVVFNTGMVILGWADLYNVTRNENYLSASIRAADWLISVMDEDGKWSKYSYNGIPHSYYSRVSWSLLEVYRHTKAPKYKDAASRNINWVLSNLKENDWIEEMGFTKGDDKPLTHTIAYTLRGLIESSAFFDDEMKSGIRDIVRRMAEKIMICYMEHLNFPHRRLHLLPGRLDRTWQPAANYSCLTGNSQIAIVWLKLFQIYKDVRFLDAATMISNELKKIQDLHSKNPGIRGAIAGSYPIWGSYLLFAYPNWATKFFSDALMLQEEIFKEIKINSSIVEEN